MSEKRILGLLGFLLGLLAGVLILVYAFELGRNQTVTVEFILDRLVRIVFGALILLGSLLLYRQRYSTGGIVNLAIGIVGLVIGVYQVGAILALLSGVLGLVANEARA
ncbi:MAG: hypothetical protein AABX97_08060 [Candidatus Thermoplasmatota archaeon]